MKNYGVNNNQKKDYKWFQDNIKDLFSNYGYSFLVIKNKKVLGAFNSYAEGVKYMFKKEPLGSFIVQRCAPSNEENLQYISSMNFA